MHIIMSEGTGNMFCVTPGSGYEPRDLACPRLIWPACLAARIGTRISVNAPSEHEKWPRRWGRSPRLPGGAGGGAPCKEKLEV